ncbi:hypothetical protein HanRHA438_Chr13g0598221 [Helianthus annuus]|nr:hypothetical protein HanRHA438_Chr13g0598221 [Helianthus annuus]
MQWFQISQGSQTNQKNAIAVVTWVINNNIKCALGTREALEAIRKTLFIG